MPWLESLSRTDCWACDLGLTQPPPAPSAPSSLAGPVFLCSPPANVSSCFSLKKGSLPRPSSLTLCPSQPPGPRGASQAAGRMPPSLPTWAVLPCLCSERLWPSMSGSLLHALGTVISQFPEPRLCLPSVTAVHMSATPEPHTQGNQEEVLGMVLKAFLAPGTIPNYVSGLVSPLTHPKFSHMLHSSLS